MSFATCDFLHLATPVEDNTPVIVSFSLRIVKLQTPATRADYLPGARAGGIEGIQNKLAKDKCTLSKIIFPINSDDTQLCQSEVFKFNM